MRWYTNNKCIICGNNEHFAKDCKYNNVKCICCFSCIYLHKKKDCFLHNYILHNYLFTCSSNNEEYISYNNDYYFECKEIISTDSKEYNEILFDNNKKKLLSDDNSVSSDNNYLECKNIFSNNNEKSEIDCYYECEKNNSSFFF